MPCLYLFLFPIVQTDYIKVLPLHPMGIAGGYSSKKGEGLNLRMTKAGEAPPQRPD